MTGVVVETVLKWKCPDCGRDNFSSFVPMDAAINQYVGYGKTPAEVVCSGCGTEHEVVGQEIAGVRVGPSERGQP